MLTKEETNIVCNIMKQGLKILIDTPQADEAILAYITLREKLNAPPEAPKPRARK